MATVGVKGLNCSATGGVSGAKSETRHMYTFVKTHDKLQA